MNNEAEMRTVILHAAEKLQRSRQATVTCGHKCHHAATELALPITVYTSAAYAEAILRLLASYLKVEPGQRANATPEPGLLTRPQPNGQPAPSPVDDPAQRFSRDAAIIAAVGKGKARAQVAREFGLSPRRIGQIVDAARPKEVATT